MLDPLRATGSPASRDFREHGGVARRCDPTSPLVFHRDGIPVRRWRTAWRTAWQAAGVPTRFLHDCRRTAARNPPAPDIRRHATLPQSWIQRENWEFETHSQPKLRNHEFIIKANIKRNLNVLFKRNFKVETDRFSAEEKGDIERLLTGIGRLPRDS